MSTIETSVYEKAYRLTFAGTTFNCTTMHDSDDDGAVEMYLDGAMEVSQSGGQVSPVTPSDSRLEDAGFVGAFGAEDWTAGWTVPGSISNTEQPDFGCPAGTTFNGETINGTNVCDMEGVITSDVTLTSNNLYKLVGKVEIGDGTSTNTLTIPAGTTIFGGTSFDFIVIQQNADIVANGTANAAAHVRALFAGAGPCRLVVE